jgi:TPR repeat protein
MRRFLPAILLAAAVALLPVAVRAGEDDGLAAYQRQDWATAARELKPLSDQGDPRAQGRYGRLLLDGLGVPKDEGEAIRLLQAAAEHNDAEGEVWLALAYQNGRGGLPRDPVRGFTLMKLAADQDDPQAANNVGVFYLAGIGVPQDRQRGMDYIRRAAEHGFPLSADQLGRAYWDGFVVPRDHAQAVFWLRKGAEGGVPSSQNVLGVALWNGDNVAKDPAEAAAWFRRAADKGFAAAQFNLGEAYRLGLGVVARDEVEAYAWHILAADHAQPKDKAKFEQVRDQAAGLLLPSEAERARQIAAAIAAGQPPPPAAPAPGASPQGTPAPRVLGTAGSGFFVARDGTVLTNNHVVPACRLIRVTPSTAVTAAEATVVGRDVINDLAILRTGLQPAAVVRFRDDKPMRSGDGVVVVGYPLSSLLSREPNVTDGVISAMAGARGDQRYFQVTAPVQKGNSGGPLADMSGNVVGVVSRKLDAMVVQKEFDDMPQNVNFALKEEYVRTFLADHGIAAATASSHETLSAADVGERIKKAAVFVECLQ